MPLIADAVARDLPVLIGVNGLNLPDLLDFCGEMATALAADAGQISDWLIAQISAQR